MSETPDETDDETPDDEPAKSSAWKPAPLWLRILAVVATFVVTISVINLLADELVGGEDDARPLPADLSGLRSPSEIVYYVEGTAKSATVTIKKPDGTEQAEIKLPLENTGGTRGVRFTAPSGQSLYVSAQNTGETGDVTCRITVNGTTVAENTSSGAYSIASCQASAS